MKSFFNSKTIRERVLMALFLLIAVAWWGNSLLARTRTLKVDWQATNAEVEEQLNWLKQKDQVAARTSKATAQLDPSRTLNATAAYVEVNKLAQGLTVEMGAVRTDRTENFALHSFQVTIRRTGLAPLAKFYEELSNKAPYLGIDKCSLSMDRASPGQVNVVFQVYSVEVLSSSATK